MAKQWILYISDDGSQKEYVKSKADKPNGFSCVKHTCPVTGKIFTNRKIFWDHIKELNLVLVHMTYDRVVEDTANQDNMSKLLDKTNISELWYGYFEDTSKMEKKSLEDLLGSINLDLYITLLKVYRGDSCISNVLDEGGVKDEIKTNIKTNNIVNMDCISKRDIPRPLLKWVGGKGQIIDKLIKQIPKKINNYHEIFVGGGSFLIMILWAKERGFITIDGDINIYDLNEALIETYNNIKNNKTELFKSIKEIETEFNTCEIEGDVKRKPVNKEDAMTSKESYYYWIRKQYNELKDKSTIKSSSYFIFLNKTGFRGMYREGPNGYNIPYGNNKNPKIIDKNELDYISELIKDVNFHNSDFSKSFENIQGENNFIYLDPPYAPENDKSFVGYTKDGFDITQHELLFNLTKKISKKI